MKLKISSEDVKKVLSVREAMLSQAPKRYAEEKKIRPQIFTNQGTRVLLVDDYIHAIDGINARQVRRELAGHRGDLLMIVNSDGGDALEAFSIADILAQVDGTITAHVGGIAASAASFLLMSADRISMSPASQIMIHRSQTISIGNAIYHREKADALEIIDTAAAQAYSSRTNIPVEEMLTIMNRDTYFSAEDSVERGFADEIRTEAYSLQDNNTMHREKEIEKENKFIDDSKKINTDNTETNDRRLEIAVAMKRFLELKNTAELNN